MDNWMNSDTHVSGGKVAIITTRPDIILVLPM